MTSRRALVLAGGGVAGIAWETGILRGIADESPVADVLAEMASDLSEADAPAFLAHFDRNMPGYGRLAEYATALSEQADVGCSIDIVKETGDDVRRELGLDWILQLSGKQGASPFERREQNVRCTFERRKKRRLVTAFDPIDFLAPPGAC